MKESAPKNIKWATDDYHIDEVSTFCIHIHDKKAFLDYFSYFPFLQDSEDTDEDDWTDIDSEDAMFKDEVNLYLYINIMSSIVTQINDFTGRST